MGNEKGDDESESRSMRAQQSTRAAFTSQRGRTPIQNHHIIRIRYTTTFYLQLSVIVR